jgi:hypothetical protein
MAVSITEIVNSSFELAAFPLSGDVAFFISEVISDIEKRIYVRKKDGIYPNISSYLYSQIGRNTEDFIPTYTVEQNEITKKITVKLRELIASESYLILFNTSDSFGHTVENQSLGLGTFSIRNFGTTETILVSNVELTVVKDSTYIVSENIFKTEVSISINGGSASTHILKSNESTMINGLNIEVSNDPFISGDHVAFSFTPVSDDDLHVIEVKTGSIPSLNQEISLQSKRANELDLISFYENQNTPTPPAQPSKIKRILKSAMSMIIEFTEAVDINTINVNATVGPAFNILSIPEEDWNSFYRIEIKQLAQNVLFFKFLNSTGSTNEIVKNV